MGIAAKSRSPMAYDDMKEHQGQTYTGMAVGGEHAWIYPDGRWKETKVSPDKWAFTFSSTKRRERSAPAGSGVPVGTQYHWYILAHQRVRKLDADTYATFVEGTKHKVAHMRPNWRRWSTELAGRPSGTERLIAILDPVLAELRAALERERPVTLEAFQEPAVADVSL